MSAVFPVLLANAAGTISCAHPPGTFGAIGASTTTFDGDPPALTNGGFPKVVTPCPGIPPAIPPCVFGAPALSMATRVSVDSLAFKPVTIMIPQLPASNMFPAFIPKTKSSNVLVL